MDGVFLKKQNWWIVLMLFAGILLVGLYFFINAVDPEATGELIVLLAIGIFACIVSVPSLLLNHKAYIHVDENTIQAKYHWFGRLSCSLSEIAFVFPQINTMTIVLKNGKRHVIMGVGNSWELAYFIRKLTFSPEKESPEVLQQELNTLTDKRKKQLFRVLGGVALLFVNIFLAVFLTGGKDLNEFKTMDWIILAVMGMIELLTLIVLFIIAAKCGKYVLPIEELKFRLRGAVVASQPLPSNFHKAVYTDENYTGRIIVCGYPNDESVYFCVQEFDRNNHLETVHTSEIFENIEDLENKFTLLIKINISNQEPHR